MIFAVRMTPDRRRDARGATRRGFSLIELVVVVIILAIWASLTVPRFARAITHHGADAAVRRVRRDLSLAQSLSVLSSRTHRVLFDLGANSYALQRLEWDGDTKSYEWVGIQDMDHSSQSYQVSLSEEPYRAVIVAAGFGGDTEIVFDGYGVPDSGGTVVVSAGGYQRTLVVDPDTGRASVLDPDGA